MTEFSRRDISRLLGAGVAAGLVGSTALAQAAKPAASGRFPAEGDANARLPIDHIVWAVPNLAAGIAQIHELTGLEPVSGGLAPGRDRPHNALLSLGGGSYLEVIAPSIAGAGPWLEQINDDAPRIVAHGRRVTDRFAAVLKALDQNKYGHTQPRGMGRTPPGGPRLEWELLHFAGTGFDNDLPFFIDWLQSAQHPSDASARGVTIQSFSLAHPQADKVGAIYRNLGIDLPVYRSDKRGYNLLLNTPKGQVFLR